MRQIADILADAQAIAARPAPERSIAEFPCLVADTLDHASKVSVTLVMVGQSPVFVYPSGTRPNG